MTMQWSDATAGAGGQRMRRSLSITDTRRCNLLKQQHKRQPSRTHAPTLERCTLP